MRGGLQNIVRILAMDDNEKVRLGLSLGLGWARPRLLPAGGAFQ